MSDFSETKSEIFERAIFGTWDEQGLVRQKGLLEQATDNTKHFENIGRQMHTLTVGQKQMRRLLIAVAVFPFLSAIGLKTDQIIPILLKAIGAVLKAF